MPVSQLLLSAAKAASNPSAKRTALRGYTSLSGDGESETLTRVALKEITPCSAPSTEPLSTGRAGLKAQQHSGWKGRAFPSVRVGHGAIPRGRDGTGRARTRAEASSRARRGFGPATRPPGHRNPAQLPNPPPTPTPPPARALRAGPAAGAAAAATTHLSGAAGGSGALRPGPGTARAPPRPRPAAPPPCRHAPLFSRSLGTRRALRCPHRDKNHLLRRRDRKPSSYCRCPSGSPSRTEQNRALLSSALCPKPLPDTCVSSGSRCTGNACGSGMMLPLVLRSFGVLKDRQSC